MKRIVVYLLILILNGCNVPPEDREDVCVKIIMVDGRSYDTKFFLPKNRSALQVNTSKGSYYLQYVDERWFDYHWVTVKSGVLDFQMLNCKNYYNDTRN